MTTETTTEIMRPVKVLIPLIRADLKAGREAGMEYFRAAGEKMLEAKPQITGSFAVWVKTTFDLGMTQAKEYMKLARATQGKQNAGAPAEEFESLNDFLRRHHGYKKPTNGHVRRDYQPDIDRIAARAREAAEAEARRSNERVTRAQERKAQMKLLLKLIDIGYKVLAKELHPDKGGTTDAMTRLQTVRTSVVAWAKRGVF